MTKTLSMMTDEAMMSHPSLREALGQRAWQPIETAPKDGSRVLLATTEEQRFGQVREGEWWPLDEMWSTDWDPTHWMDLPAPPTD